MKKTLILIGAFLLALTFNTVSIAQGSVPCVETLNQFFHEEVVTTMSQGSKPKVLNRLGTNPQFGRIKQHTSASAYAQLKSVKKRSKRQGAELDRLLRTLGYSGSEDPEFSADDITPVIVPTGLVGWMGSGSGKYFKATFGKEFEGFKIFVKDGPCFVYIMKTCGNIYYVDPPTCETEYPCPDCLNASSFVGTINPFCECTPCPECKVTIEQTINLNGTGTIASGDHIAGSKDVNLIATLDGQELCMGVLSVPVNVSYEYSATGNASASEVVTLDNQEENKLALVDLKIPVNLDFKVEDSQVSFGDDGAIRMTVTAKRFAVLKKYYSACSNTSNSAGMEGLSATEVDQTEMAMIDSESDGLIGLKKQTIFFSGNDAISEVVSKEHANTVTVIAHSKKSGKLIKGESADRYLCLGQYNVAGASALQYMLTGSSTLTHSVEICDKDGNEPAEKNVDLPIELAASFTKQEMKVGDDGKVYIEISEKQYKKMGKRFSKCCSNGDTSCF